MKLQLLKIFILNLMLVNNNELIENNYKILLL